MSTFSEKLRILRKNREWTQGQLADALSISESTVQKWEKEKNAPPVAEVKRLAEIFTVPAAALIDDDINIPEYYFIETIDTNEFWPRNAFLDSTPHEVYDAGLIHYATLHRFLNKAGVPYSAIYVGREDRLSCERAHEQRMVDYWNQE